MSKYEISALIRQDAQSSTMSVERAVVTRKLKLDRVSGRPLVMEFILIICERHRKDDCLVPAYLDWRLPQEL